MYYEINEEIARRAHEMVHMSDYAAGYCTASYRIAVDNAAALVAKQKQRVSPFYFEKLDALLDSYARRLAAWQNDYNRNQASYPSQFICGAGGFDMRKHNKQMAREDSLWKEYDEIASILTKIITIGTGAVDLTDPDARQLLTQQLRQQEELLKTCKEANAYYRKHKTLSGCPGISESLTAHLQDSSYFPGGSPLQVNRKPFPDYELSSIRGKIKRIQSRLAELDRLEATAQNPVESIFFDGGEIIQNAELNRLQILFDDIPSPELRQKLKSCGFRWSPANKAWQRQLTENAMRDAKKILHIED